MCFAILDWQMPVFYRQRPTWFSRSLRLSRREDSARSKLRRSSASVSLKYPHYSEGIWTDFRLRESCGFWPHSTNESRLTFGQNPGVAGPWRWHDSTLLAGLEIAQDLNSAFRRSATNIFNSD